MDQIYKTITTLYIKYKMLSIKKNLMPQFSLNDFYNGLNLLWSVNGAKYIALYLSQIGFL